MPPAGAISAWSASDRAAEAIRRSLQYMPASVSAQVQALLTPTNLSIMAGTLVVWAGSHFVASSPANAASQ